MTNLHCAETNDTLRLRCRGVLLSSLALIFVFFTLVAPSIALAEFPFQSANKLPERDDATNSSEESPKTIKVGVRSDARPFSYSSSSKSKERHLRGYSGYMIEICRRVLDDVAASGILGDVAIEAIEVSADNRFDDLQEGRVDLLCGPDSITLSRLSEYSVSHPVYLSGTTYISLPTHLMPRFKRCEGIIGVLDGTTAESPGLERIAETNELLRFDKALDAYLQQLTIPVSPTSLLNEVEQISDNIRWLLSDRALNERANGRSKVTPSSVITTECPQGYDTGPVVVYDSHQKGLADFCSGKILFYVGDVDIITRNASCDFIPRRETLASETYGFFFRKFNYGLPPDKNIDAGKAGLPTDCDEDDTIKNACQKSFRDLLLYSAFNNTLLRKMQSKDDILLFEFSTEFDGDSPTQDLKKFFDIFKYASGH